MQFLVIEKVSTETGLSPELYRQVPGILGAIKDYNLALTKAGKVKGSWSFGDAPGAAFILDVADNNELSRLIAASPSNAFPLTREVHPVGDVPSNLDTLAATVREGIANMDAMAKQQNPR